MASFVFPNLVRLTAQAFCDYLNARGMGAKISADEKVPCTVETESFKGKLTAKKDDPKCIVFDIESKDGNSKYYQALRFDIDTMYGNFPLTLSKDSFDSLSSSFFGPIFKSRFDSYFDNNSPQKAPEKKKSVLMETRAEEPRMGRPETRQINPQIANIRTPHVPQSKPIPAGMAPPGFEDELEIQRGRSGGVLVPGQGPPASYGDADLYPGGARYPSLDPLGRPLGGVGGGSLGGMHPTADDPLFHPEQGLRGDRRGAPGGGIRYDDPLAGPDDDLDLAGQGLPSNLGIGGRRGNGGFGSGSGGFGGGFGSGSGGFGSGFGGGFV